MRKGPDTLQARSLIAGDSKPLGDTAAILNQQAFAAHQQMQTLWGLRQSMRFAQQGTVIVELPDPQQRAFGGVEQIAGGRERQQIKLALRQRDNRRLTIGAQRQHPQSGLSESSDAPLPCMTRRQCHLCHCAIGQMKGFVAQREAPLLVSGRLHQRQRALHIQ